MKLYAEISKSEKQDDGTIKVWGYASSEAVDSDGETITAEAMKAALPDYMKFGAVREMHQPLAAGTAIEATVEADGRTYFGAHVIDPVAVKKVETGVYKGFSIGGKVTGRDNLNKSIITSLNLVEVSLVDRPANPEAVFTMFKAEMAEESAIDALAKMLDDKTITPERLLELAKGDIEHPEVPDEEIVEEAVADEVEPESEQAPGNESAEKSEQIEKGLYGVADFANLLSQVQYLHDDAAWEAQYEGDDSSVPGKLKAWLASGLKLLAAMLKEETAEILQEKADAPTDFLKTEQVQAMEKMTAELDLLKASLAQVSALEKRIQELEKQPAPGKAFLMAVEKNGDAQFLKAEKLDADLIPPPNATPEQLCELEIRKMFRARERGLF